MRRALFFSLLLAWGCSDRDGESFAGERLDTATWVPTAVQPSVARAHAAAVPLADGRVLISGGFDGLGVPLASSEVYHPATDTWSAGPPLWSARGRSAVAGDAIVGGLAAAPRGEAERALPDGGLAPLPPLLQPRYDAAAVRLPDGALLVMGGSGPASPLSSTELFADGGAWVSGGALFNSRTRATATALPSGQVLVAGGVGGLGTLAGTEVRQLDGGYRPGPAMAVPRVGHTATLLPSGDVLLVGGEGDAGRSAELYVAATGALRALAPPLQPRAGHTATLLPDGRVLLAGGRGATAAELFLPDAGRFEIAGCLLRPREAHVAALAGSSVLLAFGRGDGGVLAHAERFVLDGGAARGKVCAADCECQSGFCVDGVCCDRACDRGCETCASTGVCRTVPNQKVCRPAASVCDLEEACDGVSPACPADRVSPNYIVCRDATGPCDLPETCSGSAPLCPPDGKRPAGTTCRAPVAACDQPERCDGDAGTCPPDALAGPATVCRSPQGACDVAELCTGLSPFCPRDEALAVGTVCRGSNGVCDEAEICVGGPQCPADRFAHQSTSCGDYLCRGDARECPQSCEVDGDCARHAVCDAGACVPYVPPKKKYVGFGDAVGCAQAGGSAPLALVALLLLLARRKKGDRLLFRAARVPGSAVRASGKVACPLFLLLVLGGPRALAATPEAGFFHTGTEGHQGFALRLDALLLKDLLADPFGGEVGLTLALAERFDLGAWVSIGRYPGARLGVTLHTRDDGERFRPFLQLRGLLHPVPGGVAFGAGLFGGATAALGPGRVVLGLLLEGYAGPEDYVPGGLYALLGYQWDVYRAPDPRQRARIAVAPPPEPVPAPSAPVAPEPAPAPSEPVASEPPAPAPPVARAPAPPAPSPEPVAAPPAPEAAPPAAPASPEESTRVVTRIQIREQLLFGERQVKLDPGLKLRVRRVAGALKQLPQVKALEVAGHADDGADEAKNLALSQRRAEAVLEALVAAGVARERLAAKGYGSARALAPTRGSAKKREKNRRVDFNVLEMAAP